jgi:hypothetical protein
MSTTTQPQSGRDDLDATYEVRVNGKVQITVYKHDRALREVVFDRAGDDTITVRLYQDGDVEPVDRARHELPRWVKVAFEQIDLGLRTPA